MGSKDKNGITIKTKRLEIIFSIVYFLTTLLCFLLFRNVACVLGSLFGFMVSLGDWYLLKFMAKKWIRKGRYSLVDYVIRLTIVGVSVYFLLSLGVNSLGILLGVSIIPVSLMILAIVNLFNTRKIVV